MSRLIVVGLVVVVGHASASRIRASLVQQSQPLPIIDMHLHVNRADDNGPPPTYVCPGFDENRARPATFVGNDLHRRGEDPILRESPQRGRDRRTLIKSTFEILERCNIIAVTSGPIVEPWRAAGNPTNYSERDVQFRSHGPLHRHVARRVCRQALCGVWRGRPPVSGHLAERPAIRAVSRRGRSGRRAAGHSYRDRAARRALLSGSWQLSRAAAQPARA